MPDVSDEDVLAAQSGDETAFSRLYRAVQPGLLRYVTFLAGSDAEDVCAEAWLQACRDLRSFRGGVDGFRGWIARIARNRAIDLMRSRQRRPVDPVPTEQLHDLTAAGSSEDAALDQLSTEAAVAVIASLPRDQAEAVMLRVVMGLDANTAAKVLGKRAGAVRTAAYRGLKTLAERYDTTSPRSTDDAREPGVTHPDLPTLNR